MAQLPAANNVNIAVIGLGYVGLPLAIEFGKRVPTLGFDVNDLRIAELQNGEDSTLEVEAEDFVAARLVTFTGTPSDIADANVYIVTVPTPIDEHKRPDLGALRSASKTVGSVISPGDVVIYESTVFPGATEEVCIPVIEEVSGLKFNQDFFAGYSPERINPGDKVHRLPDIIKVTSGSTPEAAAFDGSYHGLGWTAVSTGDSFYLDHSGGGPGYSTNMQLYPERGLGLMIMANGAYLDRDRILDLAASPDW